MTRAEWSRRKGRSSSFVRKSLRFAIYARDRFDCVYCRSVFPIDLTGAGLHLDHVIPRSQGGANTPDNLITACTRCNTSKGARGMSFLNGCGRKNALARVRKALQRPLNRELGRWLARQAVETRIKNWARSPKPVELDTNHGGYCPPGEVYSLSDPGPVDYSKPVRVS
jgi:cytochrome c1